MEVANTLAYYGMTTINAVKKFHGTDSRRERKKFFTEGLCHKTFFLRLSQLTRRKKIFCNTFKLVKCKISVKVFFTLANALAYCTNIQIRAVRRFIESAQKVFASNS